MSKNVTTRWYVGAWVVVLVCALVVLLTGHVQTARAGATVFSTSPVASVAWAIAGVSSLVMVVMWVGALVRVAQLRRWGWFVAVLVLQLLWLGIVAMVAYAMSGPEDPETVTRPSFT